MPQVNGGVGDNSDVKQDIGKFALPDSRRLVDCAANQSQRKGKNSLDQQRRYKTF